MKNFDCVDGEIYRGSAPNKEELDKLCSLFKIKRIISLDDFTGKIVKSLNQNRFNHLFLPLDSSKNFLDKNYSCLYNNILEILNPSIPTFIHCLHGQDRTGLAIALYRIAKKLWPAKQAYKEARKFKFCDGIDADTKNFFISLLKQKENDNINDTNNSEDSEYFLPPAFLPQQSFAPYNQTPDYRVPNSPNNFLEGFDTSYYNIPPVGGTSGVGPMMGAGPVENSGVSNFR